MYPAILDPKLEIDSSKRILPVNMNNSLLHERDKQQGGHESPVNLSFRGNRIPDTFRVQLFQGQIVCQKINLSLQQHRFPAAIVKLVS